MKERPILFSAPMVRAILEGRKTQTRREVRKQFAADAEPAEVSATSPEGWQITGHSGLWWDDAGACIDDAIRCPYGIPGDRLWVREAWRTLDELDCDSGSKIADKCIDAGYRLPWAPIQYEADGARVNWQHVGTPPHTAPPKTGRYRHARFMPRWAIRILLEVTDIRVERLNDISVEDCIAEGLSTNLREHDAGVDLKDQYRALWESLNGTGSWAANPWVWVVEFKRVNQ